MKSFFPCLQVDGDNSFAFGYMQKIRKVAAMEVTEKKNTGRNLSVLFGFTKHPGLQKEFETQLDLEGKVVKHGKQGALEVCWIS